MLAEHTLETLRNLNNVTLALETAAAHHGLIPQIIGEVTIFKPDYTGPTIKSQHLEIYYQEGISNSTEDCELVRPTVYVTNKERTIIDLIRCDRYLGYILEAIEEYIWDDDNDNQKLIDYAKKYNLENELNKYMEESDARF